MSVAMTLLAAGASVGVGAVSATALGSLLAKPITGEAVPARLTDLAGYLTSSGSASSKGLGQEDFGSQTSFGTPDVVTSGIEDADTQTSSDPGVAADTTSVPGTAPTSSHVAAGPRLPSSTKATADQKRLLAVASFAGGLAIATAAFFLIRRVTQ